MTLKKKDMNKDVATMWGREDRDLLIELKTKMEIVVDSISKLESSLSIRETDHETRIRSLERWRWIAFGGASVLATAASQLFGIFLR